MKIEEFHDLIEKNKEAYSDLFLRYSYNFMGNQINWFDDVKGRDGNYSVFSLDGDLYADFAWSDSYGIGYNGEYKPWRVEKVVKQIVVDQVSYNRI